IDPNYISWPGKYDGDNFLWRLEREGNDASTERSRNMIDRARRAGWCMLVNGTLLYVETEDVAPLAPELQKTCHVFHTAPFVKSLFPRAVVQPPANGEMQH